MTNSQKIKMALVFKQMSESELARALGSTPKHLMNEDRQIYFF